MSTGWGLLPTDGQGDHLHMVDDFPTRLKKALADNGLDNARLAPLLGPRGQQLLNAWRKRGRVGMKSEAAVAGLLPRTNMTWLQHGTGERTQGGTPSHSVNEPKANYDTGSLAARLDSGILAQALAVLDADEEASGEYDYPNRADALLRYYDELAAGGDALSLVAKTTKARSLGGVGGETDIRKSSGSAYRRS